MLRTNADTQVPRYLETEETEKDPEKETNTKERKAGSRGTGVGVQDRDKTRGLRTKIRDPNHNLKEDQGPEPEDQAHRPGRTQSQDWSPDRA